MTALSRFLARYATCSTYEDRGTCVTRSVYEDDRKPSTETLTFATLFDRARRAFRFEYEEPKRWGDGSKRAVIWQPGGDAARLWWNIDHSVRMESLENAIAAQTGVSRGTAAEVPLFLLGGPLRGTYVDEGIEVDGGLELQRFTMRKDDYEQTMFVSVHDDVLRKYVERDVISTWGVPLPNNLFDFSDAERAELEAALLTPRRFRIERTVKYEPEFDRAIDRCVLRRPAHAAAVPRRVQLAGLLRGDLRSRSSCARERAFRCCPRVHVRQARRHRARCVRRCMARSPWRALHD